MNKYVKVAYCLVVIFLIVKKDILAKDGLALKTLEVNLPNTTLLIIEGFDAFAMCGALNVDVYNSEKMKARHVVCMRAVGVRTIDDLYNAKIEESSDYAKTIGIIPGMLVKDAFKKLSN
jgi:uncharacterized protein YunC (DUF1805 family)